VDWRIWRGVTLAITGPWAIGAHKGVRQHLTDLLVRCRSFWRPGSRSARRRSWPGRRPDQRLRDDRPLAVERYCRPLVQLETEVDRLADATAERVVVRAGQHPVAGKAIRRRGRHARHGTSISLALSEPWVTGPRISNRRPRARPGMEGISHGVRHRRV